mgnify:CR=1 FL=1
MTFKDFNFNEEILQAIEVMGYEKPTPIQEQAIPAILEGKDLIGSAQTGTGKTAAFVLPLLQLIANKANKSDDYIRAVVVVPTRELATQIDQQFEGFSYYTGITSIPVYGGSDGKNFIEEKNALSRGVDVVVCTPGRMIAHLNQGYVDLSRVDYLILDEADRMLDMGFMGDILRILSFMPESRQSLLFSATMPFKIRELARKILRKPTEINIAVSRPAEKVLQMAYIVFEEQKIPQITRLLHGKTNYRVLIFTETKLAARKLSDKLLRQHLDVAEIHSDLSQTEREQVLLAFRNRKINILVATNIISRGIDIEDIDLVINYNVPKEVEDYIHRIGRTARSQSEGVAITFVNPDDQFAFRAIELFLEKDIYKAKVDPEFGETPTYNPQKPNPSKPVYRKKKVFRHPRKK